MQPPAEQEHDYYNQTIPAETAGTQPKSLYETRGYSTMIEVIHIGGRNRITLPEWENFSEEIRVVCFDADPSARMASLANGIRVDQIPIGVGGEDGTRNLHCNLGPTTSSLYPTALEASSEWFHELGQTDYVLSRALRTLEITPVTVRSIDSMIAEGLIHSPHWLRIDAQGSELEILVGAIKAITATVVACTIEVSLVPLYGIGSTFTDVNEFMMNQGFLLADFHPISGSPCRLPFSVRGRPIPFQADVLYLRGPDAPPVQALEQNYLASAFIPISLGFSELGMASHVRNLECSALIRNDAGVGNMRGFVNSAMSHCNTPGRMPLLWDEVVNSQDSTDGDLATTQMNVSQPDLKPISVVGADDVREMNAASEEFEAFLRTHGLLTAADAVHSRRIAVRDHIPADVWSERWADIG